MSKKRTISADNWSNDAIQFPRLIAEIEASGGFTEGLVQQVANEMDLEVKDVIQLIDRAQAAFDKIKANVVYGSEEGQ